VSDPVGSAEPSSALDKLTIDTPEQLPLEYPLAGVGSRFLALFVDSMIQLVFVLVAFIGLFLVGVGAERLFRSASVWTLAVLVFFGFLVYYGYFAFFEAIWNGQTPGKRHLQLRVIKENGGPISVYDAVSRNMVRLVDQFPGLYGIGVVSVLLSRRSQRLGDFVAGTVVVHEKPLQGLTDAWRHAAEEGSGTTGVAAGPRLGAERLTVEEFRVIEAFLERRHTLDLPVRQKFAWDIAERLGRKLNVSREDIRPPEKFLEALARERRR
jgi:uncharacterized RDD family membrane protein YckC